MGTPLLPPERFGTGDFFVLLENAGRQERRRIVSNTASSITLESPFTAASGAKADSLTAGVELQVRLQCPQVDPERCIGCGICEHECPVSGLRAIRVSAEGESRNKKHSLLLK